MVLMGIVCESDKLIELTVAYVQYWALVLAVLDRFALLPELVD